jgi:hypothetical protein
MDEFFRQSSHIETDDSLGHKANMHLENNPADHDEIQMTVSTSRGIQQIWEEVLRIEGTENIYQK